MLQNGGLIKTKALKLLVNTIKVAIEWDRRAALLNSNSSAAARSKAALDLLESNRCWYWSLLREKQKEAEKKMLHVGLETAWCGRWAPSWTRCCRCFDAATWPLCHASERKRSLELHFGPAVSTGSSGTKCYCWNAMLPFEVAEGSREWRPRHRPHELQHHGSERNKYYVKSKHAHII